MTSESGATATFLVSLKSIPSANVTLNLTCSDPNSDGGMFLVGGLPSATTSLPFIGGSGGNWNVGQLVTLVGQRGPLGTVGDVVYTVTLSGNPVSGDAHYSGIASGLVLETVTNKDIDLPGIIISAGSLTVTRGDPVGQSFTVQLSTDPTVGPGSSPSDVVVISLADTLSPLLTIEPPTLVFTHAGASAWNHPVPVQVTAPDNGVVDAQVQSDAITYSASSANPAYGGGNQQSITGLVENGYSSPTVTATATTPVSHGYLVGSTVTISGAVPANYDGTYTITAVPTSTTFTYTFSAASDPGAPSGTITCLTPQSITGMVENGYAGGTVTATATTLVPHGYGIGSTVTVSGAVPAGYNGTVTVTAVPTSTTFTYTFSAASDPGAPAGTISCVPPPAVLGGSLPVTVLDNGVAGIAVTPSSGLVTKEDGTAASFEVSLLSRPAGPDTAIETVTLTSSDPGAGILAQQLYSTVTTTSGPTSTITFPAGTDLSVLQPNANMLVTISGLGLTAGAITQLTGVGANSITVSPPLTHYNGIETVSLLAATAISGGASSAGSTVVTLPTQPSLSGVYEGQTVLVTTAGGAFVASSTVRYVNNDNSVNPYSVTLASPVASAVANVTAWFSTGPLTMTWKPSQWQTVRPVTVIGMHNFQVNGNVNYQIVASASSGGGDPHYNTGQTFLPVVPQQNFASSIPYVAYTSANWMATLNGIVQPGITITDNAGYAQLTLLAPISSGSLVLTYLPTVALSNIDIDTAGFIATPLSASTIYPSGSPSSATYAITLTSEPVADVVVQVLSTNILKGTVSPALLTFTQSTPNGANGWDQPHIITITAVGSAVADGAVSFAVVPQPATSADPAYNTKVVPGVTLTTVDPNSAQILITDTGVSHVLLNPLNHNVPLAVNPQATPTPITAQFDVGITSQPVGQVTIQLVSSDQAKGQVSPASMTFTAANWQTYQQATVTGQVNSIAQGSVPYQITVSPQQPSDGNYLVLNPQQVPIVGTDGNTAGYIISDPLSRTPHIFNFYGGPPTDPPLQTTDLGGIAEFQVALNSQPSGGNLVTLNLGTSDATLGTPSPAVLVFNATNWNQPQIVTVTGGTANGQIEDGAYTISTTSVVSAEGTYSGLAMAPVPLINYWQNKIPTLAAITSVSVLENQSTIAPVPLSGIGTGEPSLLKALSVTAASDNQALIPDANLLVTYGGGSAGTVPPATGSLAVQPLLNAVGVANITVTVTSTDTSTTPSRGGTKTITQTFSVTVLAVNQAPSFTGGADQTVLENAPAQTVVGWASALLAGPPNESSQHLNFQTTALNPALFSVQPAVDPLTGNLTYTPAANTFGTTSVTVTLFDDGGTANGGSDSSASVPFNITITQVNQPPTITIGPNIAITEGALAQSIPGWASGIAPGPADEAGQTLTITVRQRQPCAVQRPAGARRHRHPDLHPGAAQPHRSAAGTVARLHQCDHHPARQRRHPQRRGEPDGRHLHHHHQPDQCRAGGDDLRPHHPRSGDRRHPADHPGHALGDRHRRHRALPRPGSQPRLHRQAGARQRHAQPGQPGQSGPSRRTAQRRRQLPPIGHRRRQPQLYPQWRHQHQ